ncbi:MAG: hypothetical protein UZ07_CHB004002275 [Chlorobi bacterium OLB7]|nr:MAG: hypothetical protein UZ07_CHB004002275 [Chlorobi bacterium OLB7]
MSNRRATDFLQLVLPLIAHCATIYYVSSLPSPPTPDLGFDWGDKVVHAGAFADGIACRPRRTVVCRRKDVGTLDHRGAALLLYLCRIG